jgi:hypothetical protein
MIAQVALDKRIGAYSTSREYPGYSFCATQLDPNNFFLQTHIVTSLDVQLAVGATEGGDLSVKGPLL